MHKWAWSCEGQAKWMLPMVAIEENERERAIDDDDDDDGQSSKK